MGDMFFISDYHMFHKNSIKFDNRPFETIEEMNDVIVSNWNNKITPKDTVYILGDMFWCNDTVSHNIIELLKGKKVLIRGNHTNGTESLANKSLFEEVTDYKEIRFNKQLFVLCHYPLFSWNGMQRGSIHLYGHLHNSEEQDLYEKYINNVRKSGKQCFAYNVGCMMPYINYEPQNLDTIIKEGEKYYKTKFQSFVADI